MTEQKETVLVFFTAEEMVQIQQAAEAAGMTVEAWAADVLAEAAEEWNENGHTE